MCAPHRYQRRKSARPTLFYLDPIGTQDRERPHRIGQILCPASIQNCPALRQALILNRVQHNPLRRRSEEHTSELQSLMRISYAVFCLKKKNKKTKIHKTTTA